MRIVLDTNILLICISKRTPYHVIWRTFQEGGFILYVTTDILNEYAEKLSEKFRPEVGENVMKAIENSPDVLPITPYYFFNMITVDPDDNKFVDCAISANANFLCTEDKHFKVLEEKDVWPSINVISANELLAILSPDDYLAAIANKLI